MGFLSKAFKAVSKPFKSIGGFFKEGGLAGGVANTLGLIPGIGSVVGPMAGSLLGGISGGDIAGAAMGYFGQEKANDFNSAQAQRSMSFSASEAAKNRAFQERMSNSAYQRGMDDMRSAGLNPILAYKQGGASSPGGNMGSGAMAVGQNLMSQAMLNANSAADLRIKKQTERQISETANVRSFEKWNKQTMNNILKRQQKLLDTQINSADLNLKVKKEAFQHIKKTASIKSNNPWLQYLGIITEEAGKVFGSGNSGKQLFMDSSKSN